MQAVLEALPSVGTGSVTVRRSGNATAETAFGFAWDITFASAEAQGNHEPLEVLVGGDGTCAAFAPASAGATVKAATLMDGGLLRPGVPVCASAL